MVAIDLSAQGPLGPTVRVAGNPIQVGYVGGVDRRMVFSRLPPDIERRALGPEGFRREARRSGDRRIIRHSVSDVDMRDGFAAAALSGVISEYVSLRIVDVSTTAKAADAYECADAMMRERAGRLRGGA